MNRTSFGRSCSNVSDIMNSTSIGMLRFARRYIWKYVRKLSSFFLSAPRSKHEPQVSRRVHTRRTRKQSSGESIGEGTSGHGRPSAEVFSSISLIVSRGKESRETNGDQK